MDGLPVIFDLNIAIEDSTTNMLSDFFCRGQAGDDLFEVGLNDLRLCPRSPVDQARVEDLLSVSKAVCLTTFSGDFLVAVAHHAW